MSQKTLIVLTLLVVGLLAFIWFVERDLPSSDERTESAQRLFRLEADQVQSVTLEWGEKSVHLERLQVSATAAEGEAASDDPVVAPDWRLIHPYNAEGDQGPINQFVDSLLTLEKKRTLHDVDPASLGVESPRAVVRLKTSLGDRVLRVGSEVPASTTMIVQVEGRDEYYVVSNSIWASISKEPGDWRSRKLFKGSRGAIERISLTSGGQRLLLAKRGADFWIEAPIADRADEEKVSSLLTAIVGLNIDAFIDSTDLELDQMELDPVRAALEVVLAGQLTPLQLQIGGPADPEGESNYARVGSQLVTIKTDLTDVLGRELNDWREHSLASMKAYEIDQVLVQEGEETALSLERADSNWRRGEEEIAYSTVSDFLNAATDLEASRFIGEDEGLQTDPMNLLLKLTFTGSETEQILSFYSGPQEEILAELSDREVQLILSVDALNEVRETLALVRSASPLESLQEEALDDGVPEESSDL